MATGLLEMQNLYDRLLPNLGIKDDSLDVDIRDRMNDSSDKSMEVVNSAPLNIVNVLSSEALEDLFMGKSESLQVKGYIDAEARSHIVDKFIVHPDIEIEEIDPSPPIYSVGKHLYSADPQNLDQDYFAGVGVSNRVLSEILDGADYLGNAIKKVADQLGLELEHFNDGKGNHVRFGSLRLWGGAGTVDVGDDKFLALPHEDLIDISSRFTDLEIADADNVYAMILCLSAEENAPRTVIWDKVPSQEENENDKHDYVFGPEMIAGADSYSIQLQPGDLGIFPAHKLHAVIGSGERCTLSCFFHIHNGKVIFRT